MDVLGSLFQGYTPILLFILLCFAALMVMFFRIVKSLDQSARDSRADRIELVEYLVQIKEQLDVLLAEQAAGPAAHVAQRVHAPQAPHLDGQVSASPQDEPEADSGIGVAAGAAAGVAAGVAVGAAAGVIADAPDTAETAEVAFSPEPQTEQTAPPEDDEYYEMTMDMDDEQPSPVAQEPVLQPEEAEPALTFDGPEELSDDDFAQLDVGAEAPSTAPEEETIADFDDVAPDMVFEAPQAEAQDMSFEEILGEEPELQFEPDGEAPFELAVEDEAAPESGFEMDIGDIDAEDIDAGDIDVEFGYEQESPAQPEAGGADIDGFEIADFELSEEDEVQEPTPAEPEFEEQTIDFDMPMDDPGGEAISLPTDDDAPIMEFDMAGEEQSAEQSDDGLEFPQTAPAPQSDDDVVEFTLDDSLGGPLDEPLEDDEIPDLTDLDEATAEPPAAAPSDGVQEIDFDAQDEDFFSDTIDFPDAEEAEEQAPELDLGDDLLEEIDLLAAQPDDSLVPELAPEVEAAPEVDVAPEAEPEAADAVAATPDTEDEIAPAPDSDAPSFAFPKSGAFSADSTAPLPGVATQPPVESAEQDAEETAEELAVEELAVEELAVDDVPAPPAADVGEDEGGEAGVSATDVLDLDLSGTFPPQGAFSHGADLSELLPPASPEPEDVAAEEQPAPPVAEDEKAKSGDSALELDLSGTFPAQGAFAHAAAEPATAAESATAADDIEIDLTEAEEEDLANIVDHVLDMPEGDEDVLLDEEDAEEGDEGYSAEIVLDEDEDDLEIDADISGFMDEGETDLTLGDTDDDIAIEVQGAEDQDDGLESLLDDTLEVSAKTFENPEDTIYQPPLDEDAPIAFEPEVEDEDEDLSATIAFDVDDMLVTETPDPSQLEQDEDGEIPTVLADADQEPDDITFTPVEDTSREVQLTFSSLDDTSDLTLNEADMADLDIIIQDDDSGSMDLPTDEDVEPLAETLNENELSFEGLVDLEDFPADEEDASEEEAFVLDGDDEPAIEFMPLEDTLNQPEKKPKPAASAMTEDDNIIDFIIDVED